MSVGEALAEARSRAGLSVDELSERTKIRGTVIRCIEQDDYDACGGDVFVRGYVRALASAVGIDARPLIREYDQARTDTSGDTFAHVARVAHPVPPSGPARHGRRCPVRGRGLRSGTSDATAADLRLPAVHTASPSSPSGPADPDVTSADLPAVSADPAITVFDLPVVTEDPAPTVADLPVIPPEPAGPPVQHGDLPGSWTPVPPPARGRRRTKSRDRRRVARVAVPAVLVLAAAGVASGLALSSQSAPTGKNAAAVTQPSSHTAHAPLTSKSATPASAAPTPTATAPAPAQPAVVRRCPSPAPRDSVPAVSPTATTRGSRRTRSPGAPRRRGRASGTRRPNSATSSRAPACSSTWAGRPRSPVSGSISPATRARTCNCGSATRTAPCPAFGSRRRPTTWAARSGCTCGHRNRPGTC